MATATQSHSALQDLVFSIASRVSASVVPVDQQSPVAKQDVQTALKELDTALNSQEAFAYLTGADGLYMKRLTAAVTAGMQNILQDGKVTVTDVPAMLFMVRDIACNVSVMHAKKDAVVQIAQHTLYTLVQAIVCLAAQMMMPAPEYLIAKAIVGAAFELLRSTMIPLIKQKGWLCLLQPTDSSRD